jgi:CheY-like chemotaxis protein
MKILHIEDNPVDRLFFRRKLLRRAVAVELHEAESAEDGLNTLAEYGFDCIVCDFELPEMDGLELLKVLREKHNETPFIMLTGKGNTSVEEQVRSSGANDYFSKETGFMDFDRLVRRIMELGGESSHINNDRD